MANKLKPYIAPEPYSGTFSAGTFDIYPADGLNYSPYNTTVGTPVPYLYPIAYTTDSIGSSADETVYVSILYYIPDINNTDIDRGTMYYQLKGGSIPNAIIELLQDPVTASGYPLSATPYSISSIGAPYQTTHSNSPDTTYMCSNNESLILALVNIDPGSILNFRLTDTNVVSMISAPLYPGQSNIARSTITPTAGEIWAVLVYRADLVWALSYKAIMFRDFKVLKYKSVTLISDKGVLIFNNPDQYVKFSSETNDDDSNSIQQHSIISVDTLKAHTIYADNIISDNTPKGGDSPTGGGILGLLYDGIGTITSQYPISAPEFSGSGFVFAGTNTALSTVGNITSGQDLSDLSIKLILEAMLMYAKPTLAAPGLTSNVSSYYYETGSTIGNGGTIYKGSSKITKCENLMSGTGLTMSFVRNNQSVILGSTSVTTDNTYNVTFNMTAETGSYNSSYATYVKATITNSKGVVTLASRTIYFRAPVFAFTNTQSSFSDELFVRAIRSNFSTTTITKVNLAKGETYTTPANGLGGRVQAYLAWPASWTFTPSSMKMYGNACGSELISYTMGYTSSVNPDVKLKYKLLAVGDPQTNPVALSLYIDG